MSLSVIIFSNDRKCHLHQKAGRQRGQVLMTLNYLHVLINDAEVLMTNANTHEKFRSIKNGQSRETGNIGFTR